MKKIFSLLALAGFVVACQPEEIETTFTVDDAVATITVTATDVATGANAFESGAVLTAGVGTVSGNVVTITGSPAISAQSVTLTVTYNDEDYTEAVEVSDVLAGGVANYNVTVLVGKIPGAYTYELVEGSTDAVVDTVYATWANEDVYSGYWAENKTQYIVTVTLDYYVLSGSEVVGYDVLDTSFQTIADSYYDALNLGMTSTTEPFEFKVSAYSIYRAWQTTTETTTEYTLYATEDGTSDTTEIATYTVKSYYGTAAGYEERAHPSHTGHYVSGGGQEGGGSNSGGGIVIGE